MGDLRDWSPESNGALIEERPVFVSASASSNPNSASIGGERWQIAEQATQGIISQVQATVVSEERRRAVIDYVQRLIRGYLGCEVFPFGSVPLKTYLPDGDIDLTAFGVPNVVDSLANDVSSVLEGEEQNNDAEFIVKDVQVINAEVKLVKCLVQNIVVDISFNQLGGLCTLCFLEQVDRLIGKDHLFKRSIILTKAWCYYESRILGAHHGLISTYALETLVLYIFHLFHTSLNGPLEVLYRFLDYFSKFDWDNYCISVNGPVRISSLPEIVAERPDNGGLEVLLSNDFLKECVDMFAVPLRAHEINSRTFLQKHLNIVDPLKENNNLGRSISKGNSYRIRSAFTYGARKLGRILLQPEESIGEELRKFFMNTLDRHGSGERPDVQDPFPMSVFKVYEPAVSFEHCQEDKTVSISHSADSVGQIEEDLTQDGVDHKINGMKKKDSRGTSELEECSKEGIVSTGKSEADSFAKGTEISGSRLSGDAKDLASSRMGCLRISDDMPKQYPGAGEERLSSSFNVPHAPHLYFNRSSVENATISNGFIDQKHADGLDGFKSKVSSWLLQVPVERSGDVVSSSPDESHRPRSTDIVNSVGSNESISLLSSVACSSKDFYPSHMERGSSGTRGSPESFEAISDLNGDYDNHFHSLQYGRWCYEYALSAPISPSTLTSPSHYQSKNPWGSIRRLPQFRRGAYSHSVANGVVPRPAFFPIPPIIPGSAFGMEELPKPRGTGTYFPNTNHQFNRPRMSSARVRNHLPVRSPRSNTRSITPLEANLFDRSSRDGSQAQSVHPAGVNIGSDCDHSGSPRRKDLSKPNGVLLPDEKFVEFGTFGQPQIGAHPPLVGSSKRIGTLDTQKRIGTLDTQSSSASPSKAIQGAKPFSAANEDRVSLQSYRLKDEEDFPPLSA